MNRLFNSIRITKPKRNLFDLSHEKKISCNMGHLVPILLQDIVPGDKFKVKSETLLRISPLIAPMMHRVNVYIHYFFVPNRLLWRSWGDFITGGENGTLQPPFPYIEVIEGNKAAYYKGTLPDYLGVPVTTPGQIIDNTLKISVLPFRAYHLIWNEYYRDQNLQAKDAVTDLDTVSSAEKNMLLQIRLRNWEKDYFTSALPWAQKGADVVLPGTPDYATTTQMWDTVTDSAASAGAVMTDATGKLTDPGDGNAVRIENLDGYDITINDLRRATKLQEWLEKNARAGSRYIEQILSHFGVVSSDARLQRPEYLGGGRVPLVISEVLNTSDTATRPQGSMAGHGISVGNTNEFKKYFEEHGYVLGIMSIMPRTAYQQGIEKHWLKFDKLDYYWPEFAHLGEQEVLNQELFHKYTGALTAPNDGTFGYQSRYAEYKFKNSSVHGDFRDTLSFWHMGRIFSDQQNLNSAFITADPTHRIFPVLDTTVHKLYVQIYNEIKALRPMPVFGSPLL